MQLLNWQSSLGRGRFFTLSRGLLPVLLMGPLTGQAQFGILTGQAQFGLGILTGQAAQFELPAQTALSLLGQAQHAVAGQTPQTVNSSAKFFLNVRHEIDQDDFGEWREAAAGVTRAHANNEDGLSWASYVSLVSGPDVVVQTLFPLSSLAELEDRSQSRRIVIDQNGANGRRWLDTLDEKGRSRDQLISLVTELSNPPKSSTPPRYLWSTTYHIARGKEREYFALMSHMRQAHLEENPDGHWLTYVTTIGSDERTVHLLIGFERFAELDEWRGDHEILKKALGNEKANQLLARLASITASETSLWRLDRGISRLN